MIRVVMAEFDRLSRSSDWIDLDFVECERTPRELIEVGIQLNVAAYPFLIPSSSREVGCRTQPNGDPQLGTEDQRTAQ
jgi:hypothetical protein